MDEVRVWIRVALGRWVTYKIKRPLDSMSNASVAETIMHERWQFI